MSRPLDDALCVWTLAIGGVLIFDVALVKSGHASLSTHAGRHLRWATVGLIGGYLHFASGHR